MKIENKTELKPGDLIFFSQLGCGWFSIWHCYRK